MQVHIYEIRAAHKNLKKNKQNKTTDHGGIPTRTSTFIHMTQRIKQSNICMHTCTNFGYDKRVLTVIAYSYKQIQSIYANPKIHCSFFSFLSFFLTPKVQKTSLFLWACCISTRLCKVTLIFRLNCRSLLDTCTLAPSPFLRKYTRRVDQ